MSWLTNCTGRLLPGVLLGLLAATGAWAQPSTLEEGDYFEGLLQFQNTYSGEAAELLSAVEANPEMDLILKDGHFILHFYGGQLEKTLLYNADSNWTYVIDPANETVYYLEKHRQRVRQQPALAPTGDSVKVLGLWCHGFRFSKPATGKYPASTTTLYVHPRYRVNLAHYPEKNISQAYWTLEGLNGSIPLKIIYQDAGLTIENTATKVVPMQLSPAQFQLPKDFRLRKWDLRR